MKFVYHQLNSSVLVSQPTDSQLTRTLWLCSVVLTTESGLSIRLVVSGPVSVRTSLVAEKKKPFKVQKKERWLQKNAIGAKVIYLDLIYLMSILTGNEWLLSRNVVRI